MEGTKKFGGDNMPEFKVLIMETLEDIVTVEAENEEEALEQAEDSYNSGEYILDSENFTGVEFKLWKDGLFKVWNDELDTE